MKNYIHCKLCRNVHSIDFDCVAEQKRVDRMNANAKMQEHLAVTGRVLQMLNDKCVFEVQHAVEQTMKLIESIQQMLLQERVSLDYNEIINKAICLFEYEEMDR